MALRFVLPLTFVLTLAACGGAVDDSPLQREQVIKLSPGDTYGILQSATQMAAAAYDKDELTMVSTTDGYQDVTISYRWHGREVVTQKFHMTPGMGPAETKLAMTLSAAPTANAEDRQKFARIKSEQGRKFDQLGKMLNSQAAADLMYGPSSMAVASSTPKTASVYGQLPQGKAPTPAADAAAPTMTAAPTLDTTASIR